MKRIISAIIVASLTLCGFTSCGEIQESDNTYRKTSGFISNCNANTLEITTDDGNIWLMTGISVNPGTTVCVVFDTMGTGDITDDEIVELTLVL